MLVALKS
jgi:hypothetical protein